MITRFLFQKYLCEANAPPQLVDRHPMEPGNPILRAVILDPIEHTLPLDKPLLVDDVVLEVWCVPEWQGWEVNFWTLKQTQYNISGGLKTLTSDMSDRTYSREDARRISILKKGIVTNCAYNAYWIHFTMRGVLTQLSCRMWSVFEKKDNKL